MFGFISDAWKNTVSSASDVFDNTVSSIADGWDNTWSSVSDAWKAIAAEQKANVSNGPTSQSTMTGAGLSGKGKTKGDEEEDKEKRLWGKRSKGARGLQIQLPLTGTGAKAPMEPLTAATTGVQI